MSEALRLADALHREWKDDALNYDTALDAAAELRRLHAENEALRAEVDRLNRPVDDQWCIEFMCMALRHVEYKRGSTGPTCDDIRLGIQHANAARKEST